MDQDQLAVDELAVEEPAARHPKRAAGSGSIYRQAGRKGWTAFLAYDDPLTGVATSRSATVGTYEAGEDLLERWLTLTATQHSDETHNLTLAGLAMRWLEELDPRIDRLAVGHDFTERPVLLKTWRGYESEVATHIISKIGHLDLAAVTDVELRRYFAGLVKKESNRVPVGETVAPPLSASMVLKVYRRMSQILTYGARRKLITVHPMMWLKPPEPVTRDEGHAAERDAADRAIEWDELDPMLAWLGDEYPSHPAYRVLMRTSGETGMRQAEACGLTWDRIDLRRRIIRVAQQLIYVDHEHGCAGQWGGRKVSPCSMAARAATDNPDVIVASYRCPQRVDGGWFIDQDTKNHQRRPIPISESMASDLAALHAARPTVPAAEAKRRARARKASRYSVSDADLVFTALRGGGHISKSLSNTLIHKAFEGAGIDADGRHVHSLRHTAATTMIRARTPLPDVQVILGHSSLQMLQRYYSGAVPRTSTADLIARYIEAERKQRAVDNDPPPMVSPDETNP